MAFLGLSLLLGLVKSHGNRTVPASKSKILVDAPREGSKAKWEFGTALLYLDPRQDCRQDFLPVLTFFGHRSSGALHLSEDLAVEPQSVQGNYKGPHPPTPFPGKTFPCALFSLPCPI